MNKIEQTMETLAKLIEGAQKASQENESVRTLHTLAAKFVAGCEQVMSADGFNKQQVSNVAQVLEVAMAAASSVTTGLASVSGADRTEGDKAAKALTMAVEANWLEGEDVDKATALVDAWNATAPKGGKGGRKAGSGGGSTAPALPFPVRVTCEHDGWSAEQTTSLNSVRWAAILHHADKHGSKPSKGTPIHQGLTEALTSVVEGKSNHAQGGGYLVDAVK